MIIAKLHSPDASATEQLLRNSQIAAPRLSLGKATLRAENILGSMTLSLAKTTCWVRDASVINGNGADEARWPLAAHLGEGTLRFQTHAVMRKYPLVERTSWVNLKENCRSGAPNGGLMSNSVLSQTAPIGGSETPYRLSPWGVHAQADPDKLGLRQDAASMHWAGQRMFLYTICFHIGRPC